MGSGRSRREGESSRSAAPGRRNALSIAAALAAHALLLAVGLRSPAPEPPAGAYRDTALEPIDIETSPAFEPPATREPPRPEPSVARADSPTARGPLAKGLRRGPADNALGASSQGPETAPGAVIAPEGKGSAPGQPRNEYDGPPPEVPGSGWNATVASGLPGSMTGAMTGSMTGAAPDIETSSRPLGPRAPESNVGKVLRADLLAHDHDLGIDTVAGGTITTAVEGVVRSSETPVDARATIDVHIGANGQVGSVSVAGYTAGGAAGWGKVASAVAGALRGKALPVRGAGAKGAIIHVAVESKLVYPAGRKKALELDIICTQDNVVATQTAWERPPSGFAAPSRSASDVAKENEQKKSAVCVPSGIGFRFDLSNIGAHRSRQIHAQYSVDYL